MSESTDALIHSVPFLLKTKVIEVIGSQSGQVIFLDDSYYYIIIITRLCELKNIVSNDQQVCSNLSSGEHFAGPVVEPYQCCRQFRRLQTANMFGSLSAANNCVLPDIGPVVVHNILQSSDGELYIVHAAFTALHDLFTYPLPPASLGIYKATGAVCMTRS